MDLKKLQEEMNSRPIAEFLGLSPNQMHLLLHYPFEDLKGIVKFNSSFDKDLLIKVPVVTKASLLIKRVGEAGELKATQRGFLPIKLVHELDDFERRKGFRHKAVSEEHVASVLALRLMIMDLGWLKKRNSKFSLTKKGQKIYEHGLDVSAYFELLEFWMFKCNWSFLDRAFECHFLQQTTVFILYLLKQKAKELISIQDFTELYIKVFPLSLKEIPVGEHFQPPEKELEWVMGRRCIEKFAAYFGLVQYLTDENSAKQTYQVRSKFKTTELFREIFSWFPVEETKIVVPEGEKPH